MSLETWKAEFYPKEAKDTTPEEALDHSIRKWTGANKGNLKRHGLSCRYGEIINQDYSPFSFGFSFTSISCALCHHFQYVAESACLTCPLYISRGGFACDEAAPNEDDSPYDEFSCLGDNKPMLAALKKAKRWVEKQKEKK